MDVGPGMFAGGFASSVGMLKQLLKRFVPRTAVSPSVAAHLSDDLTKIVERGAAEVQADLQRATKKLIPPGAVAQTGQAFVRVVNDGEVPGGLIVEVNAWELHFSARVAPQEVEAVKADLEAVAAKMSTLLQRTRSGAKSP